MKRSLFPYNCSFRAKVIAICLGVSTLSLLLAGLMFFSIDHVSMRDSLRNRLINQAEILGQSTASALAFYDPPFAARALAGLIADPHIEAAILYTPDGTVFARYTKPGSILQDPPAVPPPGVVTFSESALEVTRPCLIQKEQVGAIYLRSDLAEISTRLHFSVLIFSLVLLTAVATSFLLSWWAQPLIMRPVTALTMTARHVAEKNDFSQRVEHDCPDELGILAATFNTMLDRIQKTTTQLAASEQELIGHRRHLEELVAQRTSDLEAVNLELKDFAYIVSHDLKAPLRAISQLASWVTEDYGALLPEEGRQQLDMMIRRARRMNALIDGILQYSRIGRVQEQRRHVDLNRTVHEVIDLLAPPPHISVRIEGTLPVVFAEQVRMAQLFQNLISNAIRYMDKPRGEIVIAATSDQFYHRITVSDNGPGIEKKYHHKIFQIFQTLAPHTDSTEGTGIGLSLVKKIIELHGGTIEIESEFGTGSTFVFTLAQGEESHARQQTHSAD